MPEVTSKNVRRRWRRSVRWASAALASATAATFAVVGTSTAAFAAPARSNQTAQLQAKGLAAAKAVVAEFSKVPKFIRPGVAFNAAKLDRGKTLFSIPVDSQDQFCQILENDMAAVAKKYGIKLVDYTNDGSPSQWVAGMNEAISEHANLIDLLAGINPELVTPQMQAAKAAKIPVVASDAYAFNQEPDPLLKAVMDVTYTEAGTVMADWAITQTKGHANVLLIESNDVVSSPKEAGAAMTAFHQNCRQCKVHLINVPLTDWASKTQTQVEAQLRAHPTINYVMPVYDSQSEYINPAISLAGSSGKVHIITYDGTAFVLNYLRQKQDVVMDVGEDLKWVAYAIMDQEMRVMAGLKPVRDENTPLMIWTGKNIARAGNPPQQSRGYGTSFITGYTKLWK